MCKTCMPFSSPSWPSLSLFIKWTQAYSSSCWQERLLMSVWQADWQASRLASKWVKEEMHEGHMTGDNEEVSESRGTSVCDCRHKGLLIVQRRAVWVWGRHPCMPSLVPAQLWGLFSSAHETWVLGYIPFLYPFSTIWKACAFPARFAYSWHELDRVFHAVYLFFSSPYTQIYPRKEK